MKCINCGNEIAYGQAFCQYCGSPAPEQATQPAYQQPVPPMYQQPQPPVQQPMYQQPAPKKSNKALIIVIVVMALVIAGLVGIILGKNMDSKDSTSDNEATASQSVDSKKDKKDDDTVGLKANQIIVDGKKISIGEDTLSIFEGEFTPYLNDYGFDLYKDEQKDKTKVDYSYVPEYTDGYTHIDSGDLYCFALQESENDSIGECQITGYASDCDSATTLETMYGKFDLSNLNLTECDRLVKTLDDMNYTSEITSAFFHEISYDNILASDNDYYFLVNLEGENGPIDEKVLIIKHNGYYQWYSFSDDGITEGVLIMTEDTFKDAFVNR